MFDFFRLACSSLHGNKGCRNIVCKRVRFLDNEVVCWIIFIEIQCFDLKDFFKTALYCVIGLFFGCFIEILLRTWSVHGPKTWSVNCPVEVTKRG